MQRLAISVLSEEVKAGPAGGRWRAGRWQRHPERGYGTVEVSCVVLPSLRTALSF